MFQVERLNLTNEKINCLLKVCLVEIKKGNNQINASWYIGAVLQQISNSTSFFFFIKQYFPLGEWYSSTKQGRVMNVFLCTYHTLCSCTTVWIQDLSIYFLKAKRKLFALLLQWLINGKEWTRTWISKILFICNILQAATQGIIALLSNS